MTTISVPKSDSLDRTALLAGGVTVVLWASAFAGIRVGLDSYSPESVALLRYLIASVVLVIYALMARMGLPEWRDLPGIFATGFLGFTLYNVALNAGEVGVSAGAASFIVASAPVWMLIMAWAVFGDRVNRWGWLGVLISFGGVTVISLSTSEGLRFEWEAILVLIAAIVQAAYSIGQRGLLRRYGALRFATYAIWAGTAMLLVFTPGLLDQLPDATTEATLAVVYMGVFPGAVGYVSWSIALARLPSSTAASFLYLIPAVATLIAWVWLGEVPGIASLFGGALVVIGVIVVNTRGREKRNRAAP